MDAQFKRVALLARRNSAARYLIWSLVYFLLAESLILSFSALFAFSPPSFVFLIPLVILPSGFLLWLKGKPDSRQAAWLADRHLKLEERLITSFEVLKKEGGLNQLESRLLEDTARRLRELGGKISLPRGDFHLPTSLILIAILLFSVSPFLPSIRFSRDLEEQALTRIDLLLELSSFLPGYERQILSLDLLKARKMIEEDDWSTAGNLLEEGRALLEQVRASDERAQDALASIDELSFLAKGLEAGNEAALEQLKKLSEEEMNRLARGILDKLDQLPAGPLKSTLTELANSLEQRGWKLEERVKELSSLFPIEETLLSQVSDLLQSVKQGSGSLPGEKTATIAGSLEGDLSTEGPSGLGTVGEGSLEKGAQAAEQKEYIKAPQGKSDEPTGGLIYVPRELREAGGETMVLPREGKENYQLYRVGEGQVEEGSLIDYKTLLADFRRRAAEGFARQVLPLDLRSLVSRYFMQLEEQP